MAVLPGRTIALVLSSASVLVSSACSEDPSSVAPAAISGLELTAPDSLLVGASAPLIVTVRTELGPAELNGGHVQWASSNTAIARVAPGGMVTGLSRGSVTITARAGALSASVLLRVHARVMISPFGPRTAILAVNDTIQLQAVFVNVYGRTLPDEPQVVWSSSRPDVVSVSATGLIVARQPSYTYETTVISATTVDGVGATPMRVVPAPSGFANVRFVHAASELGPLEFVSNKNPAVTLDYGQTMANSISPGALNVSMPGFPRGQYSLMQGFAEFIGEGQGVTLYASGDARQAFLIPAWNTHPIVRPDRSLVRIVMASSYGETSWTSNLYFLTPGAPLVGWAQLEDFYMPAISEYVPRPAEEFDIVKMVPAARPTHDQPGIEVWRLRAKPEAGRAMTFVVTGHSRETLRLLTFIDP
jgi:hypothetical protein